LLKGAASLASHRLNRFPGLVIELHALADHRLQSSQRLKSSTENSTINARLLPHHTFVAFKTAGQSLAGMVDLMRRVTAQKKRAEPESGPSLFS
jgi:hypothetical protein